MRERARVRASASVHRLRVTDAAIVEGGEWRRREETNYRAGAGVVLSTLARSVDKQRGPPLRVRNWDNASFGSVTKSVAKKLGPLRLFVTSARPADGRREDGMAGAGSVYIRGVASRARQRLPRALIVLGQDL